MQNGSDCVQEDLLLTVCSVWNQTGLSPIKRTVENSAVVSKELGGIDEHLLIIVAWALCFQVHNYEPFG